MTSLLDGLVAQAQTDELADTNPDAVVEIDDLPLDPTPEKEGDDSMWAERHGHGEFLVRPPEADGLVIARAFEPVGLTHAVPQPGHHALPHPVLAIHFPRIIRKGMRGPDVVAVKRALAHAGYLKWHKFSGEDNQKFVDAVKRFQKQHKVVKTRNGVYDKATHHALVELRHFDARGAALMHAYHPGKSWIEKQRAAVVAVLMFGYYHRDEMDYEAVRLMEDMAPPPNVNTVLDCSEFYTWGCESGHVRNPNGHAYNGAGYTGEISLACRTVPGFGLPGDAAIYKPPWPYGHVAGRVGVRRVVSMGSDPGPLLLDVLYRPPPDYSHVVSPWPRAK